MSGYDVITHPISPWGAPDLEERELFVALPPGYADNPTTRYPVLYMNDGQNLFGEHVASRSGWGWRLDRTAAALLQETRIEPLILVGVPSSLRRAYEYTDFDVDNRLYVGGSEHYCHMLVDSIKPFVDRTYRTSPDASNTGLGGSSYGSLISLYAGVRYPHVFGKLALLSTFYPNERSSPVGLVNGTATKPALRIWLDIGTGQGDDKHVQTARALRDALVAKGCRIDEDLAYLEALGAEHHEEAWAERVPLFLPFLFPGDQAASDPSSA